MTNQILQYYSSQSERLLKDFDRTAVLLKDWLIERYGKEFVGKFYKFARIEYARLIPEIPFIEGGRAKFLNSFLLITAQELAAYLAMKKLGKSPSEAWEICHLALRLRVKNIPRWKRWLMKRFMFSGLVSKIISFRAKRLEKGIFGDFEIEYLDSKGKEFDLGINYLKCANYNFVIQHGGEDFAPYVCMSDIALSDAMGWGLIRTQTLADGCKYCDFRFKKDGLTKISSQTPEVQKVIEQINKKESEQDCK